MSVKNKKYMKENWNLSEVEWSLPAGRKWAETTESCNYLIHHQQSKIGLSNKKVCKDIDYIWDWNISLVQFTVKMTDQKERLGLRIHWTV